MLFFLPTQIIVQILPTLEQRAVSLRELKGRLVLALGEALADKLWCRLLESRLLDDISSLQREIEGEACGRLAEIALAVAASEGEAPEGPQMRVEAVLLGEMLRAMRRRPTSRAAIYDLYIQHTTSRGVCYWSSFLSID